MQTSLPIKIIESKNSLRVLKSWRTKDDKQQTN